MICNLFCGCAGAFFYPDRIMYATPQELGVTYEERVLDDGAGPKLMTWLLPAKSPQGLVVHLHGNAENMSSHLAGVYWLPRFGFEVLLSDYRGYGGSAGSPTLGGVNEDVVRIIRYAMKLARERNEPLFLFGQSMGASLGLYAASKREFQGIFTAIVAESAFSSYRAIAREKLANNWITATLGFPFLFTIPDKYAPLSGVGSIQTDAILFITGEDDAIVDAQHSEKLFQSAAEPKQLWRVPKVGHLQIFSDSEWRVRLVKYFRGVLDAD